eukprot:1160683-Pelagomonas_calceolata.AAC.8
MAAAIAANPALTVVLVIPVPFVGHNQVRARCGKRQQGMLVLDGIIRNMLLVRGIFPVSMPGCLALRIEAFCTPFSTSEQITPLDKKGSVTDAGNYRMLAVSGTFNRLDANVLRTLLQDWCLKNNKVPDCHLGFFPGRSTLNPLSILRHLKDAAQNCNHMAHHACLQLHPS